MNSYLRIPIFVTLTLNVLCSAAAAMDFDRDGLDDFVVIDINSKKRLEWYAVDLNDAARRPLGEFGSMGNHLAVGSWSGDDSTSKGLVSKQSSGALTWDIDLPKGKKTLVFGNIPAQMISGLDVDNNGAIDPATVVAGRSALEWKILNNPGLVGDPSESGSNFGNKKAVPFFANPDGSGDQVGFATVNKKGTLSIRTKKVNAATVTVNNVLNFKSSVSSVLPVETKNGRDLFAVVSGDGAKLTFTFVNGRKRIRRTTVKVDPQSAIVVGDYLGSGHQVVVVRKNDDEFILIEPTGRKKVVSVGLKGILADDINMNSFSEDQAPTVPPTIPTNPPATSRKNPACSGTMVSTAHLLYKPNSDTNPENAVIVFDGTYQKEFVSVSIQLSNGTFAEGYWRGLALWGNPIAGLMRQHWRVKKTSPIANNALIIANDGTQECRFQLPGSSSRRWE